MRILSMVVSHTLSHDQLQSTGFGQMNKTTRKRMECTCGMDEKQTNSQKLLGIIKPLQKTPGGLQSEQQNIIIISGTVTIQCIQLLTASRHIPVIFPQSALSNASSSRGIRTFINFLVFSFHQLRGLLSFFLILKKMYGPTFLLVTFVFLSDPTFFCLHLSSYFLFQCRYSCTSPNILRFER